MRLLNTTSHNIVFGNSLGNIIEHVSRFSVPANSYIDVDIQQIIPLVLFNRNFSAVINAGDIVLDFGAMGSADRRYLGATSLFSNRNPNWPILSNSNYTYVPDDTEGVLVVDISDLTNPQVVATYAAEFIISVALEGGSGSLYGYVARDFEGLDVIDLSDPLNPALLGSELTEDVYELVYLDDHVYATDGDESVNVYNVVDKANPSLIATITGFDYNPYAVLADGIYLYILDALHSMYVYDISTPATPTLVDSDHTSEDGFALAIRDNYLYVADGNFGLLIYDVTDPTSIQLRGTYTTTNRVHDVTVVSDGLIVTAVDHTGFELLDVTDPTSPQKIGEDVSISSGGRFVTASGSVLYIIHDTTTDMSVWDVADPTRPAYLGALASVGTQGAPVVVW